MPASEEEVIPQLMAAQGAAIRGDHVDTLDSIPDLVEEVPTATASNSRGGAPLT